MTTKPKLAARGWRSMRHPVMTGAWVCRSESDPIQVLSAVELAEEEAIGLILPSYHVSAVVIDAHGAPTRSCTDSELDIVREAFQMDGADEDNHGHGLVRHLWLAVGARVEDPCACKQDEPTTVDGPREWRP